MVAIPNTAKLISTMVNAKTGTTIKKLALPNFGEKAVATLVEYGENNPLKKRGVDAFVKITGASNAGVANKALFSGDKMILSGTTRPNCFKEAGDFNARYKTFIDMLKKTSENIKADQISAWAEVKGQLDGYFGGFNRGFLDCQEAIRSFIGKQ